jgi:hypothetical protein
MRWGLTPRELIPDLSVSRTRGGRPSHRVKGVHSLARSGLHQQGERYMMIPKDILRAVVWMVALFALAFSSSLASDDSVAKHPSKITKAGAERIALAKMPGGRIRSAELETTHGRHFWSVYIAKPGSKNAKEIRVDATSGQILAVQTERPEDQAEEPAKTH